MEKIFSLLLLLIVTASGVEAQQYDSVYLEQASQQDSYLPQIIEGDHFYSAYAKLPILSLLQQIAVDANQVAHIRTRGNYNQVTLSQNGTNNIAAMLIRGHYNITSLAQNGAGLLSVLNIRGNANNMEVNQTGQNLQNYIQVTGNGLEMDIRQNASGIRLTQTGGQNAVPLQIKTQGQQIPLIIRNY